MLDVDKSHLDVTWVSQSLYSGPLSNPDFFLSLIADRIRQVVLYMFPSCNNIIEYSWWSQVPEKHYSMAQSNSC